MRLTDESAAIWDRYPEAYADLALFVTELGGSTGLIVILAVIYWLTHRHETALVASYAVVGVGVIIFLKGLFAMPRPPESVYLAPLTDDPYGFPSGHAFMAVVVYGGLLVTFDRLRDLRAVAAVGTLIVLISLSRVVLGFHYLGDIIAGATLGVLVLGILHRLVDGVPARGFAIGVVVSLPAIAISNAEAYALVALGAAIGGVLAATRLEVVPPLRSRLEGAVLSIVGVGSLLVLGSLESILAGVTPLAIVPLNAVLIGVILLLPAAVGRFDRPVSLQNH